MSRGIDSTVGELTVEDVSLATLPFHVKANLDLHPTHYLLSALYAP